MKKKTAAVKAHSKTKSAAQTKVAAKKKPSVSAAKTAARSVKTRETTKPGADQADARSMPRRELYPPVEPYRHGYLRVSDIHELYYEECGNPAGKPAIFLHGGPGAGADRRARQELNWAITPCCRSASTRGERRENISVPNLLKVG